MTARESRFGPFHAVRDDSGRVVEMVPDEPEPRPPRIRTRKGWWLMLQMAWDAIFRRQ